MSDSRHTLLKFRPAGRSVTVRRSVSAVLLGMAVLFQIPAYALKSDRQQPALVDAEEVDMDFKTGKRIYRGNVLVRQGTLRIEADQITTTHKDGVLQIAVAIGKPAIFRQRPDGKDYDVIGKGLRLELDHPNDIITLHKNARVEQNQDSIAGETIVYNMSTEQLKVRGGTKIEAHTATSSAAPEATPQATAEPTQPAANDGTESSAPDPPAAEQPVSDTSTSESGTQRSRIVIQPKTASSSE